MKVLLISAGDGLLRRTLYLAPGLEPWIHDHEAVRA